MIFTSPISTWSSSFRACALSLLVLSAASCSDSESRPEGTTSSDASKEDEPTDEEEGDSSDAGSDVQSEPPDYDAAFPQDRVARLDITLSASAWKQMLDNMTENVGEFGAGGGFPGGGSPGGGPDGFPSELTSACEGKSAGATCESSFGGMSASGTCTSLGGNLACLPEGGPGGAGGFPGGGGSIDLIAETPIYVECDVATEDRNWKHVGIRFKGNSSLSMPWSQGNYKLPLRLKFDHYGDAYPEVAKQRFYGFKNLNLSNGSNDQSLLREKLGNDVFLEAGFAAPASAFYRVYIDHGDGPTYFGLYTGIELPSDKAFLETHFDDSDGNLYKPDGTGATFATWVQESFEKENNEEEADYSDVKAVFDALHADRTDAATWRAGLESVFDVDTFLHWLALNTVIGNWDAYGSMSHNYYLYGNPQDRGRLQWIPWDQSYAFNSGMGGPGGFGGTRPTGGTGSTDILSAILSALFGTQAVTPSTGPGGFGRAAALDQAGVTDTWPLIRFLIDDPVYKRKYDTYVAQAAEAEYAPDVYETKFKEAHELIAPYVVGDDGEVEGYSFISSEASFEASLDELIAHVRQRQKDVATYLE